MKQENGKLAIVTASLEQLNEVGIDEAFLGKKVQVFDIDKYWGMHPPCSKIVANINYASIELKNEYIIPTKWLSFQ